MNSPFFSIIITTYNRCDLLPVAIKSVVGQIFANWELIIIDDGSVDDTKSTVIPFLEDSRIKYYYQENQERSVARNNGIKNATGNYICFLDDDDYYLKNHLQTLKHHISENISFYFTGAIKKIDNQEIFKPFIGDYHDKKELITKVMYQHVWLCSVCVKRDVLLSYPFNPSFALWEDINLFLKIIARYGVLEIGAYTVVVVEHSKRNTNDTFVSFDKNKTSPFFNAVADLFKDEAVSSFLSAKDKKLFLSIKYHAFFLNAFWYKNYQSAIYYFIRLLCVYPVKAIDAKLIYFFLKSLLKSVLHINNRK